MKKVLVLGAGMVSRPLVRFLLDKGYYLSLADMVKEKADAIIASHPNAKAIEWNVDDEEMLDKLIKEHDLIVSLLPWVYHVKIAVKCIKHKKNMLTSSYVKEEMRELDAEAKKAGIIILNEVGLDPGIDHMSAKRIIDQVHKEGGRINEFYSFCGALPAPEACDNPFKYKFSWSPKGVILASNNDAKYLKNGKVVEVKTEDLFKHPISLDFPDVAKLEVYPNRDSISYRDIYEIPEAKTVLRGTFRYKGWCVSMNAMKKAGLFSNTNYDLENKNFAQLMAMIINVEGTDDIRQKVAEKTRLSYNSYGLKAMEWLGLFDNTPINRKIDTPINIVADLMINKMMLGEKERDMVALQHIFKTQNAKGKNINIISRMLEYGTPETDTAISRTVALPAAIACDMILRKTINLTGVHIPVIPELYNPILDSLNKLGIKIQETYSE